MGADGDVEFYDADAIDAAKLTDRFYDTFVHTGEVTLHGHRYYTVYSDTNGHEYYKEGSGEDVFGPFLLADLRVWS
jgi:hypothetical protein